MGEEVDGRKVVGAGNYVLFCRRPKARQGPPQRDFRNRTRAYLFVAVFLGGIFLFSSEGSLTPGSSLEGDINLRFDGGGPKGNGKVLLGGETPRINNMHSWPVNYRHYTCRKRVISEHFLRGSLPPLSGSANISHRPRQRRIHDDGILRGLGTSC